MPNKIKCSTSRKAQYSNYQAQNRKEKNKERKLLKHLEKHPNDVQSLERKVPDYKPTKKLNSEIVNK